MDDATKHANDDPNVTPAKDDDKGTSSDEGVDTPAGTDDDKKSNDDPKNTDGAQKSREAQKSKWLNELKEGKITIDEMPENLKWLTKDPDFDQFKKKETSKPKEDDFYSAVDKVLDERDARKEFNAMIDDLQELDIDAEKDAQLKEEFEDLLSGLKNPTANQTLKALKTACRLVGIKEVSEAAKERRKKGMVLPPLSGKKRKTVSDKQKETEIEKRLGGNLPPGFTA